jgi:hypothetical protein
MVRLTASWRCAPYGVLAMCALRRLGDGASGESPIHRDRKKDGLDRDDGDNRMA